MDKKIFLIIGAILTAILFTGIFYFNYVIVDVHSFDMHVNITSDHVGFNVDNDKMYFGAVSSMPGFMSERRVEIGNPYDFSLEIVPMNFGEISDYVLIMEGSVTELNPGESGYLYYRFVSAEPILKDGEYTGTSKVFLRRAFD